MNVLNYRFILVCFFMSISSVKSVEEQWSSPPFEPPDLLEDSVNFTGTSGGANIELNEEVTHSVCIAQVNYKGTSAPQLGSFSTGQAFNLGAEFRQNTNSKWDLYITKKQDYETATMQAYRFEVAIGSERNNIALNIINIDDNPPVIQPIERNCAIEENFLGRSNCSFLISDADWVAGISIDFSSTPESGSEKFKFTPEPIPANDHELKAYLDVIEPVDFEAITTYLLQVKAKDSGNNEGTLLSVIQVIDMPDEPPVWTSFTASQTIMEKCVHNYAVSAIDGDIQIDAKIHYKLETENSKEGNLFSIDTETGKIKVEPIDRDTLKKEVFRFFVTAYEKENITSSITGTVVIIVEDQNDHSPEIIPETLSIDIAEEQYMTLDFAQPIVINDPDLAENGQYSVSLKDDSEYQWSTAFVIVPNSGYQSGTFTISVLNASLLDYEDENWRNMRISIEAIEVANKSHVGSKAVIINLTNRNDEFPTFEDDSVQVQVPENVPMGQVITTMLATDKDVDDAVAHELMSQKVLSINESTGEISTAVADALDYETMPVVVIQVVASDLVKHKAYATLTINVIDVNDTPPKLFLPKDIPSLLEEVPSGTVIQTKIEAMDVDTDADLVFAIDWDKTTAQKSGVPVNESCYREHLAIESLFPEDHHRSAEGKIVVIGRIDYEAFDVMFLNIIVTDRKTVLHENSTSASLTLKILDKNDNPPVFHMMEQLRVTENAVSGTLIGSVRASDADGPEFNQVSYYIKPANNTEDALISIDKQTGTIRTDSNQTIDAEKYEYIYYEVIASDGDNNSTLDLNIFIIDMNDEVPHLLEDNISSIVHIPEKSSSGTEILTIYGKDDDRTSPYNNVSYLINENYSAPFQYFELNRFTGVLKVHLTDDKVLDRDFGNAKYTLNLKLRDNYVQDGITWNTNSIDTEITVILDDINDQIPKLPALPTQIQSENVKTGSIILEVTADDRDDPTTNNTKVSYTLLKTSLTDGDREVSNNCVNIFSLTTKELKTAVISAAQDLRGCYGTWALQVHARDHGVPSLEDTRTYQVKVTDYNYNDPVISYPTAGATIVLSREQTLHATLKTYDKQPLPDFKASDDDFGESGTVSFSLMNDYFEIIETDKNSGQLQLKAWPVDVEEQYKITVTAIDNGDPPRKVVQEHVIIFVSTLGPKFQKNDWTVWIKENKTGLDFWNTIPEAFDNINIGGVNLVEIYYFIDDKIGNFDYFNLDKLTRNLTVLKQLDREQQDKMTISVITTADSEGPPRDPRPEAVLNIEVIVLDENDNSPVFDRKFYSGGVAVEDNLDKVILTIRATDADLNDTLRYCLIEETLNASDSSISTLKSPFLLDTDSGEIRLKFSATSNMAGFFNFTVVVQDHVDHKDQAVVQIYMIVKSNRVVFTFRNNAASVSAERNFLIDIFSRTFGYICNVDDIKSSVDGDKHVVDNVTTLTTHFIDSKDNLPIEAGKIILASSDLQTVTNLKADLQRRGLFLIDVPTGSSSGSGDTEDKVYWVLLSLTILFSLSTVAVFVGYFMRTRTLTRRLDKMAVDWKGGGEERETREIAPTTNKFATAGSNPIWNVSKEAEHFADNVSHQSGDSDLIGIEENPDFGYVNPGLTEEDKPHIKKIGNNNAYQP